MTVILAAIACKELLGKAIEKAKEKVVQWATERQIRKWQKKMQEQMEKAASTKVENESNEEVDDHHAIVRRARTWNREGGTLDFSQS